MADPIETARRHDEAFNAEGLVRSVKHEAAGENRLDVESLNRSTTFCVLRVERFIVPTGCLDWIGHVAHLLVMSRNNHDAAGSVANARLGMTGGGFEWLSQRLGHDAR